MRFRGVVAGGLLAALLPLSPVLHLLPTAEAASCSAQHVTGKWTSSSFPLPTTQYDKLVRDPADRNRLFATDGSSVMRSTDAGCTWKTVYGNSGPDTSALPGGAAALPTTGLYYVSSIVPSGGSQVYLTLAPGGYAVTVGTFAPSTPPVLIGASSDGGATFKVLTPAAGAASASQPRCNSSTLAVAPSEPKTLYLACNGAVFLDSFLPPPVPLPSPVPVLSPEPVSNPQAVFYVSSDGGMTWALHTQKGIPQPSVGLNDLFVDPFKPASLWARVPLNAATQTVVIVHSVDAGLTWHISYYGQAATGTPDLLGFSFVHKARSQPARLVAWGPAGAVESLNEGVTWIPLATNTAAGTYQAAFDLTATHVAVSYSSGAPCTAAAKLFVFDLKKPQRPQASVPVAAAGSTDLDLPALVPTAPTKGYSGIVRVYPSSGAAYTAACVVPAETVTTPVLVAPRPSGSSWTSMIVSYAG